MEIYDIDKKLLRFHLKRLSSIYQNIKLNYNISKIQEVILR